MEQRRFNRLLVVAVFLGTTVGLFAAAFRVDVEVRFPSPLGTPSPPGTTESSSVQRRASIIGAILYLTFYPGTLSTLIRRFHRDGSVPLSENLPIIPSGFIGLLAGQSAGPEGVMSAVGGSLGTRIAHASGERNAEKILTLAGMGAGFGAILGAPIGGGLLWLELPHERGMEYYEAIVPTLVASFAGYLTMVSLGGISFFPAWHASAIGEFTTRHLVIALGVGLVCVLFAAVYTRLFALVGALFNRWSPRVYVRTTVAGLGIGLLGYALPLTYFYGGKHINDVLTGSFPFWVLILALFGKMLAAAITINGNWQGGLIVPQMFMGALVGRAVATVIPGVGPVLAMLTGMAAFNAAVTGTPLSSALIAIALTDGASIVPVFLASLTAFVASPLIRFIETTAARTEPPSFHVRD